MHRRRLATQDFVGGLAVVAVAGFAWWLARGLPGGASGGMGPGTLPKALALGGQVDYMCDQIVNLVEQVKGGSIRAYAIATPERSPALPDVPTTREAGLPDYQVSAWNALFGPKGMPKEVHQKLSETLVKALDDEATRKRLLDLGSVIPDKAGRSPQALQKLVESEVARWNPILKGASQ